MVALTDLDPRTPVVVGASEVVHRDGPDFVSSSATALMLEAVTEALAQSGVSVELGSIVGEVLVPHGTWTEIDPGRAIAQFIGAPAALSVRSELGVLQHSLLARAAQGLVDGRFEAAIVVGGENRWSGVVAGKGGTPVPDAPEIAVSSQPDERLEPSGMVISQIEIERNLTTAAHQYAIIESALRHDLGRDVETHQRSLGELWEQFAQVAAQAPKSWDPRALNAREIAFESDTNRMIASPYPKWLISQWNVDQAAALVFTTVGVAERLGIASSKWVFPLAMAESNIMIPLPERADLFRWPAAKVCGDAVLESAGVEIDEVGPVDLYSCFPAAVQVQATELGLAHNRYLTVTGGMTFGGGPFNNYALQSAAAMVALLQKADHNTIGLTSAVSGLLTKPAVALWSNSAPRWPFAARDLSSEADAATDRKVVDPALTGVAVVVGATVIFERDGSFTTVAIVESGDGRRSVAQSQDSGVGAEFTAADPVGRRVFVTIPGQFGLE